MKRLFALALSMVLFCGCAAQPGGFDGKLTVNEVTHSVFYAPFYAAITKGYFAEEGMEIELVNGGGADKVMTAVLTGDADIGLAGPEACIYVAKEGGDDYPKIFAQLTKRDGSFLVGREDVDFTWDMTKGTTIIGGRKGGVPEMTLEYVMKQNGVVPHEEAVVDTAIQFNMMAGAFASGVGDYVALFEPVATQMELEGTGYVLASIGQDSGEIPYTAFFAGQDYQRENPEIIEKFTKALEKGQTWIQTATPEEIGAIMTEWFPDTDQEILIQVAKRYQDIDAWCKNSVMTEDSFNRLQDVMTEAGQLDSKIAFDLVVQ